MLSLRHGLLNYTFCQVTSVSEPEPPGAATFRKEPEPKPPFLRRLQLRMHTFWQTKEDSLVVVTKHYLRAQNEKC